ncbi:MAG TPA: flagellar hook-length control protein FliK [Nevskiaceae bacterium]|nr:flagellar hook-length control protein FliK [Nevskiaceae bacterium]
MKTPTHGKAGASQPKDPPDAIAPKLPAPPAAADGKGKTKPKDTKDAHDDHSHDAKTAGGTGSPSGVLALLGWPQPPVAIRPAPAGDSDSRTASATDATGAHGRAAPGTQAAAQATLAADLEAQAAPPQATATQPATNRDGALSATLQSLALPGAPVALGSDHTSGGTAAALLTLTAPLSPSGAPLLPVVQHTLSLPVAHPDWSQAVAEAIVNNVHDDGGRMQLQLNPANLGPVDIALDLDHDHAKLHIVAAQPMTRVALQQAIPQLTSLFAAQGLQLTHADVSAGQSGQQQARHDGSPTRDGGDGPSISAVAPTHARRLRITGLVDAYV